jgi:hypothetical protein
MARRNKIVYWVVTIWLALGMVSTGLVQVVRVEEEVDTMTRLGYPVYFLTILGIWKILGVVAILVPKFPLVKEWAYAGFFFAMSGATLSRIASGGSIGEIAPSMLLLFLTVTSWYVRPSDRRIVSSINA